MNARRFNYLYLGLAVKRIRIILTVSILVLKGHEVLMCQETFKDATKVTVGDSCPPFKIKSLNGDEVDIAKLKGKIVLINFFATWCKPCQCELPEMQARIWPKYRNNKDFELVVIGRGHTTQEIVDFQNRNKFDMPMYADSAKKVFDQFAVKYIPRTFIVDRNGIVVYSSINYTESELQRCLKKLDQLLE